jgi:hypothetical protein
MKKALLVLAFVLVAGALFANPFIGKWVAQVGQGQQEQFMLVIDETTIIRGDPVEGGMVMWVTMGEYTVTDEWIVIKGVKFLYYVDKEEKRIGLVGWIPTENGKSPALIILFRAAEEAVPDA